MSIPMKTRITGNSARKSKEGGLVEINLSVLVPTANVEKVANALEEFASLMPSLDFKRIKGVSELPKTWASRFKNKGHEIKVITTEGERVLNIIPPDDEVSVDNAPILDSPEKEQPPKATKERRFNKFGEEVVSLEDILPDMHSGKVLKGFRLRGNMTQQQLADALEVRQSRVCDLENGTRTISKAMAQRLARLFKTSYKVFL